MKARAVWLWMVMALGSSPVWAANHYVRAGASGNGSDWSNAYGTLPATLIRGDTYYIAAGTYASYHFDDAASSSSVITIKKATAADHGTETGWNAAYGDGQAAWNGTLYFDTGNWIFDGQTRDESDWMDDAGYGFKIYGTDQQIALGRDGVAETNIQIRNACLQGPHTTLPSTGVRWYNLDMYTWGGTGTFTGIVVSRCFLQYGGVPIFCGSTDGMIVEYSAFDANQSNAANHGEAMSLYYTNDRFIIRYNKFRATQGTAVVAVTHGDNTLTDGFQFYGNVIWDCQVGDGIFGFSEAARCYFSNTKIYNNTIVDEVGYNSGIAIMNGNGTNYVYNNLWVNCSAGFWQGAGATYSHNAYSWSSSEPNAQANVPTSIFVNYAGDNFGLAAPTTAGFPLTAPYNTDMFGNTRGADGVWDRGAYEYTAIGIRPAANVHGTDELSWLPNPVTTAQLFGHLQVDKKMTIYNLKGKQLGAEKILPSEIYLLKEKTGKRASRVMVR